MKKRNKPWKQINSGATKLVQTHMYTLLRIIRSLLVGAGVVTLQLKAALRIPAKYMCGIPNFVSQPVYTQFACVRGAANYGKPSFAEFRARETY